MARTFVAASSQVLSTASAIITAVPYSFVCWYNPTSVATVQSLVGVGSTSSSNYTLLFMLSSAKLVARSDVATANSDATSVASLTAGTWFHCAGVFASITSRVVYLNTVSASNSTSRTETGLNISSVGAVFNNSSSGSSFANGAIAFPAIWDIDLSASDITSLFNGASPKMIRPDHLKSYVKCTGATSPEPDFPNSSTWTLTGTPAQSVNPRIYFP